MGPSTTELGQCVVGFGPGLPGSAPAVTLLCTGLALDTLRIAPECSAQPGLIISPSAGAMCRCLWENPPFSAGTVSQCSNGAKLCSSWGILLLLRTPPGQAGCGGSASGQHRVLGCCQVPLEHGPGAEHLGSHPQSGMIHQAGLQCCKPTGTSAFSFSCCLLGSRVRARAGAGLSLPLGWVRAGGGQTWGDRQEEDGRGRMNGDDSRACCRVGRCKSVTHPLWESGSCHCAGAAGPCLWWGGGMADVPCTL